MTAVATITPSTVTMYLVRVQNSDVVFVPINKIPNTRNYFLLEVCEVYAYSEKEGRFQHKGVTGILSIKHGENQQKMEGFKSCSTQRLLERVRKRVSTHYTRTQR